MSERYVMDVELLEKLCNINAVSANENELAKVICEGIKGYVDEVKTDSLGNVIAHKKGDKDKIMITARMDETGGLVTFVEDNGRLRFNAVGECEAESILHMTAVFSNGVRGIICCDEGKKEDIKFSDLYVDIGAENYDEAVKKANIGDVFCVFEQTVISDSVVMGKGAGARSGVFALAQALKNVGNTDNDIYAVFAGRSQVGFKGARAAGFEIEPKLAVCIGENAENSHIKCGKGIVINIKDSSMISDRTLVDRVRSICDENKISYVCEVSKENMSEGAVIKKMGEGVKTIGISLPVRYKKMPRQSVNKKDITSLAELIKLIMVNDFNL